MNYTAGGLLFDGHLTSNVMRRGWSHYIRDWMHTLVSNGVAGTHLALMCQALIAVGCSLEIIRTYSKRFTLPWTRGNRGKISDMYFKDALMETDHVRHFASDVLGMIPLLYAFLVEKIKPRGEWRSKRRIGEGRRRRRRRRRRRGGLLVANIECFSLLHTMLCILRRGVMNADIHTKLLSTIVKHNTMFLELYGDRHAKLKFHHLYHLPDDLLRAGIISCFPTERKNKDALAVSVATDFHIERSSTIAFLHRTISHWCGNTTACKSAYLLAVRNIDVRGEAMSYSTSACLPCGDVFARDMVLLINGSIGRVVDFWQRDVDQSMSVRCYEHKKIGGLFFELASHGPVFDDVSCIVEAVTWYEDQNHFVVCMPLTS